jgi:6-pyruvoyltetrahydropterin/6-carboxytetrahydropterin synthase
MDIFIDTTFEAAHRLPSVVSGHKCGRLHGHSFMVRTTWRGPLVEPQQWVVDFDEVKMLIKVEVHEVLDHSFLNDVEGLENPTSENLAVWIWRALKRHPLGRLLAEVQARESCTTGVIYRGEGACPKCGRDDTIGGGGANGMFCTCGHSWSGA